MTQALMHTAVRAHTSAAMHALTQLTQAGVSVSCEVKRWHAQAAVSTQRNKNVSVPKLKGGEGSEPLSFPPRSFSGTCGVPAPAVFLFLKGSRVRKEEPPPPPPAPPDSCR